MARSIARWARHFANNAAAVGIKSAAYNGCSGMVEVQFTNDKVSSFEPVWLLDNDHQNAKSFLISEKCKARVLKLKDLDLEVVPKQVHVLNGQLEVQWPSGQTSNYSPDFLLNRDLSNPAVVKLRHNIYCEKHETWDSQKMQSLLKYHDFKACTQDTREAHDAWLQLRHNGIVFLSNAQPRSGELDLLTSFFGWRTGSHYGDTFKVVSDPVPSNLAYTTGELEMHVDLPYYEAIADIQVLHCIAAAGDSGGKSLFTDGFRVAEIMRKDHPEEHELLKAEMIEYCDEGIDITHHDVVARHPVFSYNREGRLTRVVFNNQIRSWFLNPDTLRKTYKALKLFLTLCRSDQNCFSIRLREGDVVAFDNTRVLHGRTAFEVSSKTNRYLEGMYLPWDGVLSKVRHLKDRFNLENNQVSF